MPGSPSWGPETRVAHHRTWMEWDLRQSVASCKHENRGKGDSALGPSLYEVWAGWSWNSQLGFHTFTLSLLITNLCQVSTLGLWAQDQEHVSIPWETYSASGPLNFLFPLPAIFLLEQEYPVILSFQSQTSLSKTVLTSHFKVTPSHIPFSVSWFILLLPEVTIIKYTLKNACLSLLIFHLVHKKTSFMRRGFFSLPFIYFQIYILI